MRFMRKHSENSSNKFMSNSHDSLSKRQAVLFSFKEISLKEGITSDNADSHKIDNSPEMAIASFRILLAPLICRTERQWGQALQKQ